MTAGPRSAGRPAEPKLNAKPARSGDGSALAAGFTSAFGRVFKRHGHEKSGMAQSTFDDDDLFGEAAEETRAEVEEHLAAAREELPDPDRVFIGGSGGKLWSLLETVDARLNPEGRVVLTASTLDTLTAATDFFENNGYVIQVTTVNIARTSNTSDYKIFEAQNPVNIVMATKDTSVELN